ncbi:SDR family oxidoreductase [Altericroceibacterium xinjiangense]|uniref:SDR family oxidoreductase n=1 Tax=Altericroceibacterium xinjiangense TaxID=762261 RepID=UPI000F7DFA04|nr:SDR family oxidoreductase [Altericroceibacterium xinjiangense]
MKRTALITGGGKRIGAAITRAFADAGWHAVIHCNSSGREAEALAATLPSAEVVQCDLSRPGAGVTMIAQLAERLEDWRVLVNSAAIFPPDDAEQLEPEVFSETMQVNAKAPVEMAQTFLARAHSRGGKRVIQLTDQKLANPNPDFFSYTISKHAIAASVPMMAMAGEPGSRVYALAPGAILASHDQSPAEAEVSHRLNLLERRTSAAEVAEAALFLAEGWLESGQTLFVDSGQSLLRQPRDVLYLARKEERP